VDFYLAAGCHLQVRVALAEALSHGWLAGAGLDVFEQMPISPESALLKAENVVLSPYMASITEEKVSRVIRFAWHNVRSVLDGRPPEGLIT
jgi:phosphoglycerate dehydrogenase-like enzyme